MWIFTDTGFVSAVAFDPKLDKVTRSRRQVKSYGKNPILVRARLKDDLEQLRPFWSKLKIEDDASADYEFRAVMPRKRWADFLATKGSEIDYDSHFKEVAQKRSPNGVSEGTQRHTAMMSVWSAMSRLQPNAPYSGSDWYSTYGDYGYGGNRYVKGGTGTTGTGATGYNTYGSYGTAMGPKSAQASSQVFASSLCPQYTEYFVKKDGHETKYRRWCNEKNGHKGDHKFGTEVLATYDIPKTQGTNIAGSENTQEAKASYDKTHEYDTTNPFDMPDSVEDMCRDLLVKSPDDIRVDPATPFAAYDLYARVMEEFKEPLTHEELLDILDELIEDVLTVEEARQEYTAVAHKFTAGIYHTGANDDLDVDPKMLAAYDRVVELDLNETFIPNQSIESLD